MKIFIIGLVLALGFIGIKVHAQELQSSPSVLQGSSVQLQGSNYPLQGSSFQLQ